MLDIPGFRILGTLRATGSNVLFHAVREADGVPVILKTPMSPSPGSRENERYRREFVLLVLQILINLLSNAKHALDGVPEGQRNLWVRLEAEGNVARIQVEDDGVGIAPELMDSLFAHGFTTRKDGHGFGLHSSALAAQMLKGRLTLESAGLGQGAVATLELPLA
ncbi:serine/threonine protein kinase [Cystobacter fuscus]|uniref:histidine kinase n=1 Tax=Cystobacter fuscus TaxID=43 RepID=A0A250J902_9BACT|nr:ATP-binding protein [Cystobacter fuscus]ATB40030.1 serine/threonine protein kinase [Cystobacter fuscus]